MLSNLFKVTQHMKGIKRTRILVTQLPSCRIPQFQMTGLRKKVPRLSKDLGHRGEVTPTKRPESQGADGFNNGRFGPPDLVTTAKETSESGTLQGHGPRLTVVTEP